MNNPKAQRDGNRAWTDNTGECIKVDPATGLVRVDGVAVFKVFAAGNSLKLQFKDGDKMRSHYRGSDLIEVDLSLLIECIMKGVT